MITKRPGIWRYVLLAGLLVLGNDACVTIHEGATCSVAGELSAGGICSHLISSDTHVLTFREMVDFLEAQPKRVCIPVGHWSDPVPPKPAVWVQDFPVCAEDQSNGTRAELPARGAAILMSSSDWSNLKTSLELACRELGNRCSYEVKKVIENISKKAVP